jgi:hypothetical protein
VRTRPACCAAANAVIAVVQFYFRVLSDDFTFAVPGLGRERLLSKAEFFALIFQASSAGVRVRDCNKASADVFCARHRMRGVRGAGLAAFLPGHVLQRRLSDHHGAGRLQPRGDTGTRTHTHARTCAPQARLQHAPDHAYTTPPAARR